MKRKSKSGFAVVKARHSYELQKIYDEMDKQLNKKSYLVALTHKEVGHLMDCLAMSHHVDGVVDKKTFDFELSDYELSTLTDKLESAPEVGST